MKIKYSKKKMMLLLLFIIWLWSSFLQKINEASPKYNSFQNLTDKKVVQIIELGIKGSKLELLHDEYENSIFLQTKRNGDLISEIGRGNSEFIKDKDGTVSIDTLVFSMREHVYLITSYIKGSTYGAENYFLVFKKLEWLIMALPFDRARFYDTDQDGFDEIVEYNSQIDSAIYTFSSGLILPK